MSIDSKTAAAPRVTPFCFRLRGTIAAARGITVDEATAAPGLSVER